MLAFFAALMAAAPSPTPAPAPATAPAPAEAPLESATPWWEKITVTVDDKGTQQSCRYETSAAGSAECDKEIADSIRPGKGIQGQFKKVTFERRFSPGGQLDAGKLQPGDMLLGRQVMFLTIDAKGAIQSCKVVASSGDAPPDYERYGRQRVEEGVYPEVICYDQHIRPLADLLIARSMREAS